MVREDARAEPRLPLRRPWLIGIYAEADFKQLSANKTSRAQRESFFHIQSFVTLSIIFSIEQD